MKQKYCLVCGKAVPRGYSKYCSKQCCYSAMLERLRTNYKKSKEVKYCDVCHSILPLNKQRFCCNDCYLKWTQQHRNDPKPNKRYCLICGKEIKLKWYYRYCSADCLKIAHKNYNVKQYEKRLQKENYEKLMKQLAVRSAQIEQPFLSQFNSIWGVENKQVKSHCILDESQAVQLGIQPIFDGSMLYWQPKTKALYLHVEDKYYALTAEF